MWFRMVKEVLQPRLRLDMHVPFTIATRRRFSGTLCAADTRVPISTNQSSSWTMPNAFQLKGDRCTQSLDIQRNCSGSARGAAHAGSLQQELHEGET